MTNRDKINQLSNEELAIMLASNCKINEFNEIYTENFVGGYEIQKWLSREYESGI